MTALLDMRAVAARLGLHYDTVRKGWEAWVRDDGFPAPVRDSAPYRWRLASIEAWEERAEARNRDRVLKPATEIDVPANQNTRTLPPVPRLVARQRDAVMDMMMGAAR